MEEKREKALKCTPTHTSYYINGLYVITMGINTMGTNKRIEVQINK